MMETTMQASQPLFPGRPAILTDLGAVFVSLELSRSCWVVTSMSPGGGEKMSRHSVTAGNIASLLELLGKLRTRAKDRTGRDYPVIVIQEAGLDGFWIDRVLQREGHESHVVDAASVATSRRRRRAKTDKLDGEALVRALLAYKRGEPRVCSMVRSPSPKEEDRRRIGRERRILMTERVQHVNRIKGLLFAQGIYDYSPMRDVRGERLQTLLTGDGRPLCRHLLMQLRRELARLAILLDQIKAVEIQRDEAIEAGKKIDRSDPIAMLLDLRGIGPEAADVLWSEGMFRRFCNRRQLAAYAGLAPTPWQSGSVDHEQGVSKAGNPRLRTVMIQVAWLWLRHQPHSALARWFEARVERSSGRQRKTAIVALARKLLVALWRYVTAGVVIEGAIPKPA
jgi:transposase